MRETLAHVLKYRFLGLFGGFSLWHDSPSLLSLIKAIRLSDWNYALPAAAPPHFDPQTVGWSTRGEDAHGLIAGKVTPAAHDFLGLSHRPTGHRNMSADTSRVRWKSFQAHRQTRSGCFVAINPKRAVEIIDHHIQVAVV